MHVYAPPRSGLVHGHEVKAMLEESRAARMNALEAGDDHGQGVAPTHRIGGRLVTQAEWNEEQLRNDPKYRKQRRREIDADFEKSQSADWKFGLEQSGERLSKAEDAVRIASEPIGSASLAAEVDEDLRKRARWDDPLSHMDASRRVEDDRKPRSRFQAPPNRFNIAAGYRWDGVVRGNEHEKRWFERSNEVKSIAASRFRS